MMAGSEPAAVPTIAIIGGGLTGLLTAQALQKHGFSVKVFEREAHVDARPRDWTILVHWGMPILAELTPSALAARLPDAVTTPHLDFTAEGVETFPVFNGLTGELLMRMPSPGGRRFSRQKLRKILVEGLDVAWGKKVAAVDGSGNDRVKVSFEDGSVYEADFVVGADGPNSTMRELLVGKEAAQSTSSGLTWTTGITKYEDAAKVQTIVDMHPVAALSFSPAGPAGYGVLDIPDANDMTTWTTFWVRIYKGGRTNIRGQEAIDYIKEITKGLHKPFQDAIDWTPAGSSCYADEMRYWVPTKWESFGGRVTLLGDAAHPMLPYRGQGLQHALTDAKNFAQIMVRLRDEKADAATRQAAMAEFDAEVVARGATAVRQSVDEAEKSLDPGMISKMLMMSQGFNKTA